MSKEQTGNEVLAAVENNLGQVLAAIHRILPRLDEPGRSAEVQAGLRKAGALLDAARSAYEQSLSPKPAGAPGEQKGATRVAPDIAAVIAAAVSVVLDRPFRLVAVHQVPVPAVPHFNVWAFEGRTQIFQSHKVR
ncbi:MAG TPA: hypothetical protein VHI52_20110 [Verrucomicrobiae bacterium]|nr:hypothetical protein [Verrucomicrobiae bacterium]